MLLALAPYAQAQEGVTRGNPSPDSKSADPLRLATWNIRWFPHGCPDPTTCPERRTDTNRLAREIADIDIDLLALQEIVYAEPGKAAMHELVSMLDSLTGGVWKVNLQDCGPPEAQRVGFLWNAARVELSGFADMAQLNGGIEEGGGACAANLRPGRYAYARSVDGTIDFHAITVHFDSGRRDKDYNNRRDATAEIPRLRLGETPIVDMDEDVVIFGDFNTMGQGEPTEITAEDEFRVFDSQIGPNFKRIPLQPFCSEYYRGQGGVLDFFVVSKTLASPDLESRVHGYCAEAACSLLDEEDMPDAYRRVSDHCPVVLQIGGSNI
ncbi:MAG: endonuclease/exonuclease/phosphatase family protein [Rhodothermales bacterium]|nr:endonuclease/exonuclease/phosphatase family protein [Rhodothermales bacterium]